MKLERDPNKIVVLTLGEAFTPTHLVQQMIRAGYDVLAFEEAQKALEAHATEHAAIVLLDLAHPEIADGWDCVAQLQKQNGEIPVILAGPEEPEAILKALRAGAVDYLPTPVADSSLKAALERAREALQAREGQNRCAAQERVAAAPADEWLAAIVESSEDAIIGKTLEGIVTYWNAGAERIYGYTPEEMVGQPITTLTPPDSDDEISAILERIHAGEHIRHFETTRATKEGRAIDVSLSISPIRNAEGEIVGASAISRDITGRKEMENKLRESEARYRTLFETMAQGVVYQNAEGKITTANPAAEQILGLTLDQMQGRASSDPRWRTIHEDGSPYPSDTHPSIRALRTGEALFGHVMGVFNPRREAYAWISVNAIPEFRQGEEEPYQVYASFEEITTLKETEQQLREALAQSEQRRVEVSALLTCARAILNAHDFPSAARTIFDTAKEVIGATAGYVALLNEDGTDNELLFLDSGGESCIVDPTLPMPIRGLRAKAYTHVRVVYDNDFTHSPWQRYMPEGHAPLGNVLFAPLVVGGEPVGLIGLANKTGGFTENDARLMRAFGELSAIALQNSWTEEALRASEHFNKTIVSSVGEGIVVFDRDLRCRLWNEAIEELMGIPADDVLGKNLEDRFQKFYADHGDYMRRALAGEYVRMPDTPYNKPGSDLPRWFTATVSPHRSLEGTVLGVVGTIQDVTERKQAEAELREAQKELEYRVQLRTTALLQANEQLQQEVAERKRIEEELLDYAEKQALLYAVASATTGYTEPQELLAVVLDTLIPGLLAEAGWIFLKEETPEELPHLAISMGVSEDFFEPARGPLEACPACREFVPGDSETYASTEACLYISQKDMDRAGFQSFVNMPLHVGRELLGVLGIAWRAQDVKDAGDGDLWAAIGRQVGLALYTTRLYRSARQVDRLKVLNQISTAASASLELDVVLPQILELTCRTLNTEEGSILLRDQERGELVFAQTLVEANANLKGQRMPDDAGIAGWAIQHGETVRVDDVHSDPRWYKNVDTTTDFETRSILCTPLIYHQETIGVLEMLNKEGDAFTGEDVSILEAVASITAGALENARLFSAVRLRAEEMATLNEIGQSLIASLDFQQVTRTALLHIQHLFRAQFVGLFQDEEGTGRLSLVQSLDNTTFVDTPLTFKPGESMVGWAFERRQAVLARDVWQDPRFTRHSEPQMQNLHATMVTPLMTPEHTEGVIVVCSERVGAYTREDLHMLQAIASTLSVALQNATLYAELKAALEEREATQAQLIHAEKMAALGRLAASIAHEINNPLQAVLGCMRLSQDELTGRMRPDKLGQHLDVAISEVKRVSQIVLRMHDFYRHARTDMEPVDLHEILDSILALSGKQLQHSAIAVERDYAAYLPTIEANPDHLKQVFLNMVLNAIDAMHGGGTLHIHTTLEEETIPSTVKVGFEDTGEGMSPEVQARLFEPFFTTKDEGTGLGLSISYGIIESHNGKILISSREGEGTTFTILLPVRQP